MIVYHFLNEEYGLESLEKRRLKVSQLDSLNDPFEHIAVELSDRELRDAMRRSVSTISERQGIICFSQTFSSPVMWSHYADRHEGICLGFEVPERHLSKVRYQNDRITYRPDIFASDSEARKLMLRLATTKFSDWSYENEWRAFIDLANATRENELYFVSYSDELKLRKVIVGHHSKITRQQIGDVITVYDDGIDSFKARPAFKRFAMVRQKNDCFWK